MAGNPVIDSEARVNDIPAASAEMDSREHGREPGAGEYASKPFNLPQLAALLRRRLGDPR